MKKQILIGTSGWSYEHWKGPFYKEIPNSQWLEFYSRHFSTVEINTTFYHLPSENTVKNWVLRTPKNFIFSVKASRYITHVKRLKDYELSTEKFFTILKLFQKKLGPILFQLPPSFALDLERLENFLELLPNHYECVFEFRNHSWMCEETYDLLRKYNAALCISDLDSVLSPLELTANFTYIRLHGPKSAYQGSYSKDQLMKWQKIVNQLSQSKIKSYLYFDNDEKGFAIKNALSLLKIIF